MLQVGQRVRDYEIVAPLSQGGMASLYLARRRGAAGFERMVALKIIHPHLAKDQSFVRMFVDEARLCSQIQHPNVVHVEELGEEKGMYFLAMEFVHGTSLSQLLKALARKRERLLPALAVNIAIQVADGLHAAHELTGDNGELLGVVHRDVSPQNILLAARGFVKLIDFGIAKSRSHSVQTQTGSLKGKLRYMAPEQASGQSLDRRTDVYALGIVLWEMLTMRRYLDARDDFAVIDQARNPKPVPPSSRYEDIEPALDAAVLAALAPSPDDRPATALDFREMLADALPEATRFRAASLAQVVRKTTTDELKKTLEELPASVAKAIEEAVPKSEPGTREIVEPAAPAPREKRLTLETDHDPARPFEMDAEPSPARPMAIAAPAPARQVIGWWWVGSAAVLAAAIGAGVTLAFFAAGASEPSPPAPPAMASGEAPAALAEEVEPELPSGVDVPLVAASSDAGARRVDAGAAVAVDAIPRPTKRGPRAPRETQPTRVHGTAIVEEVPF